MYDVMRSLVAGVQRPRLHRNRGNNQSITNHFSLGTHGRGCGVGRSLGGGIGRGVGVGRTVAVGVAVGVGVCVGVGLVGGVTVAVAVAVAVAVGVGVASDWAGAWTVTEIGEPVLKNPMLAVVISGRRVGIKSEVVQCAEANRVSVLVLCKRLAVPGSRRGTFSEDPGLAAISGVILGAILGKTRMLRRRVEPDVTQDRKKSG